MIDYSEISHPNPGDIVGRLTPVDPQTGSEGAPFFIYSRREVLIGRKATCDIVLDSLEVSHLHVRIYTALFDDGDPDDIAPLVYAQNLSSNGTRWNGYRMARRTGVCILSDGDILALPSIIMRYNSESGYEGYGFDPLQSKEMKACSPPTSLLREHRADHASQVFEHEYKITTRLLGSGGYGQVHMAYDKATGQQFACKIIDLQAAKSRIYARMEEVQSRALDVTPQTAGWALAVREQIARKAQEKLRPYICEADILHGLCHPNIIGIQRVFRSSDTIYLVQELAPAGDLLSFLQFKGKLDECHTAVLTRQVAIALDYLHDQNIVHRDLKPENILITSYDIRSRVILSDFGCAKIVQPASGRMSTMVGTFDYSAPEILRCGQNGYTEKVDMWSLGCLTFLLMTGSKAVFAPKKDGSPQLSMETNYDNVDKNLRDHGVSPRAYHFVSKLLIVIPEMRMSAKEALRHDWFTNKCHARIFEGVYRESIEDWRPLPPASSTLSDPILPPYNRAGNVETDALQARPHMGSQYSVGLHTLEFDMDENAISTNLHTGRMPDSWVDYEQSISAYHRESSASMEMRSDSCESCNTECAYIEQEAREVIDNITRSSQHVPYGTGDFV
ncbi:serine/threonine protein kinase [Aspergillus terreus]|uniref:Serine/threonine protein kinase n=1 Tax=Aspergillus terreus TaxID=33178 RepID=A0A5M3ZB69_ASPTE|nr:hypothetical protein ATETN484_0013031500 [Aspergillus terreus]GFF20549.1 serine/threonine protein kinase [Aspergillus terreus]